jgi:nickel transport system substrate-binding protein
MGVAILTLTNRAKCRFERRQHRGFDMSGSTRRDFLLQALAAGTAMPLAFSGGTAQAQGAGTLRVPISKEANDLNPWQYTGLWVISSLVYEPLVGYGPGGEIVPALAESWLISDDGLNYRFTLRQGVSFSDGTPFGADAALWNLKHWIGIPDHSWLMVSDNFLSMEKVDDFTITIALKAPAPPALIELSTIQPMRFLSPASADADGNYVNPIGTGRWIIESSDANGTELVRNDAYWGEKPGHDRLSIPVIPEGRSRVAAMQAGELDMMGGSFAAKITPQEAETLSKVPGITVITDTGTDTIVLAFNPNREITKDVGVRNAISLCLDRAAIAQVVMNGYADPTMNLYPPSVAYSGKRETVLPRDVEAAKALLEAAGWAGDGIRQKDGVELALELVISEDAVPGSRSLGEVIQSQLGEAGIAVSIRQVDHVTRHDDIPKMIYDMSIFITTGAPYDPHGSMTVYFISTFVSGTDGKMFMDAENLDPLITAALSADEAGREAGYQAIYDWLAANHAICPIYHAKRIWAHTDKVSNFVFPTTEYEMPDKGIVLSA